MAERIGVRSPAQRPALQHLISGLPKGGVIGQIAANALLHPTAIAVASDEGETSYARLMAAVSDLAVEMTTAGAGPEVLVGICMPRCRDLIVAMLAALRTGGAFLPLDPGWPLERIRRVLEDAGCPVVVAPPARAADLAAPGRHVLGDEPDGRRVIGEHGDAVATGEHLAYVIYTSGSTGEPKGIEINKASLANLVDWHVDTFGVGPADRVSCLSGLSFDALVWELLPALAAGATICLTPEAVRSSAAGLQQWLIDQEITIAYVPTTLAETLIATEWPATTALRTMLTGGDALHVWPKPNLPFTVVNNYGPSECTVVATSGVVPCRPVNGAAPTIGRPIANCRVYILGDDGAPVRPGEVGEIHLAGANVGRGYRGRPALTAEKFFANEANERLYRTGDLGSWTAEGDIAFHGRRDEQLKIRGYRVEPNEISAALDRHPSVGQSAVVLREEGETRRLVAYVVPTSPGQASAVELRKFLAGCLPVYMLPDLFVRLDALPLTANGKLDRLALPRPTPDNTLSGALYREPSSDVERQIAQLIQDLLRLERVGADDNFFLLGGHSLLGTQLVLGIRERFGAELMLRDLFEGPTVAQLAHKVEEAVFKLVSSMGEEEVRRRLTH
ncbi:MAG: non-ribosomal peptide synthetase [Alphaproteobacteria bacterium]|nr:non-ribosomal peptide synthetase [Alphaproteobacteria bacterium]